MPTTGYSWAKAPVVKEFSVFTC